MAARVARAARRGSCSDEREASWVTCVVVAVADAAVSSSQSRSTGCVMVGPGTRLERSLAGAFGSPGAATSDGVEGRCRADRAAVGLERGETVEAGAGRDYAPPTSRPATRSCPAHGATAGRVAPRGPRAVPGAAL